MAKLGYTWYPKDWGNSEAVFQLNLSQRGLYRELIDLAMLTDNKTIINLSVWARKWDVSEDELKAYLQDLKHLYLIDFKGNDLFIPSCEPRLKMVRGGRNGGKKSKPTPKPIDKPLQKPTPKQREKKEKGKEIEIEIETGNIPAYIDFLKYAASKKPKLNEDVLKLKYDSWVENDWKDGNDKPIKNWKTKVLNTLPYIEETSKRVNTNPTVHSIFTDR